jgi:penicillin-binding protein 2
MNEPRLIRGRLFRGTILLLFGILCVNLFLMQVPRHQFYKSQALENRQLSFPVKGPRGRILDRDGNILADNLYIADITVPPKAIREGMPNLTLSRLLAWFQLPEEETIARLMEQKERGLRRLVLINNASLAQCTTVEEYRQELPGARVDARARRRYVYGPLFAHIVGYVGEVNQVDIDLAATDEAYRPGDMIGKLGIEKAFESRLKGRDGEKIMEVNASGQIVISKPLWRKRVRPSEDVKLTLSVALQDSLSLLLAGRPGCGVALAVPSGEILAAVSSPSYDPNLMTIMISPAEWQRLSNDPAKPFFNRIIQATYPPGSLYKPITSLCGLSHDLIGRHSYLEPCGGGFAFGNRWFRCWKRGGHGVLDHGEALVHSCDVFYYQLGLRLELDILHETALSCGLGQTCSDLFSEEVAGNIPTSAWYDDRYGQRKWTRGVMLNNAIGQGEILVTPLQMAQLAALISTSGKMNRPTFVLKPAPQQQPAPALPFTEEDMLWVRHQLEQVVDSGTGTAANLAQIAVAGKTGTAQNPHGNDHAWFMCYAPADSPEVALAIILENAGHGGAEAAPVAGRWLHAYFNWVRQRDTKQSLARVTQPKER